jgi:hypothetical protein
MSKKTAVSPEQILKDHTPQIQVIAEKLRAIVKNTVPNVTEKAYPGWHGIGYTHQQAGYFCCIFPHKDKVSLALEYGALLPDPDNLLILPPTSSKQVRYVEMHTAQDVREDEIVALLHAAIRLW